jgi:hypothetical protein
MSATIAVEDKASASGTLKAGNTDGTECSLVLVGFDGTITGCASLAG